MADKDSGILIFCLGSIIRSSIFGTFRARALTVMNLNLEG
jgi:hypothetical protein